MPLLKHSKHFQTLNQKAVEVDAKRKALGNDKLSREERVLDTIWTAIGILENGSFQYFSECELGAEVAAQACEEIGMHDLAATFRSADSILKPISDTPWKDRLTTLIDREEDLDKLASEILDRTLVIESKLFDYLKTSESRESIGRRDRP